MFRCWDQLTGKNHFSDGNQKCSVYYIVSYPPTCTILSMVVLTFVSACTTGLTALDEKSAATWHLCFVSRMVQEGRVNMKMHEYLLAHGRTNLVTTWSISEDMNWFLWLRPNCTANKQDHALTDTFKKRIVVCYSHITALGQKKNVLGLANWAKPTANYTVAACISCGKAQGILKPFQSMTSGNIRCISPKLGFYKHAIYTRYRWWQIGVVRKCEQAGYTASSVSALSVGPLQQLAFQKFNIDWDQTCDRHIARSPSDTSLAIAFYTMVLCASLVGFVVTDTNIHRLT